VSGTALKVALTFIAVDMASGALRLLENKILGLGKASQKVRKDFEDMVRHTQAGLKSLAAAFAIEKALAPGIKTAASMEEAVDNLKMTLHTAHKPAAQLTKELEKAREVADDLQKITPFSSRQIIQSETALVRAGIPLGDVLANNGAAYAASTLATILEDKGVTPESAAEMLSKTATAFHIKGGQYGALSDLYQRTLTSTVLGQNPGSFATGMGNISGTAAAMGLTPRETIQFLATVAGSVSNPEEAGTYAKDFLLRLTGARKTQKEEMERLHLNFWTPEGNLKSLQGIKDELRGKTSGLSKKELTEAVFKIFGLQGLQAALALQREGMGSYEDVGQRLDETSDTMTKLKDRLEGLDANLKSFSGTVESAVSNAFRPMLHTLTEMTKVANDFVDAGGKWAGSHQKEMGYADWGIAGIGGAAGLYGIYRLIRAGVSASSVIAGLSGVGLGVAEGKILQKTAGITPVFVTGAAPGVFSGAGGGSPLPAGTPTGAANTASKLAKYAPLVKALGFTAGLFYAEYELNKMGNKEAIMGAADVEMESWLGHTNISASGGGGGLGPRRTSTPSRPNAAYIVEALHRSHYEDSRMIQSELAKLGHILEEKPKNQINLSITVDQGGRVTSRSDDPNTTARIDLKRGDFFGEH